MSTRGTTGGAATGRGRTGNRGSTAASRAPPEVIAVPANPQQSPPYPIDVEAIEDEVQVLSSSAGFPQPRSRPRRNRLVTVILDDDAVVILDDDAEVSAGVAGVTSEEPSTTLSLNTHERHQRLPPNGTAVNSEINSNSPGSTEVGCNHAQSVGFSTDGFATTTTMRKLHLIWVTARMHIEIYKYPAWGDVLEIETWCQGEGRIGTRRDWILKDFATGEVIGRATSKWVMMNQDTRKLERVIDEVKEEYFVYCPSPPRYAFPEEDSDSLKKIPKLEDPAEHSQLGLVPRRADLDMNQHVNNVTYIGWVLESIPQVIIDTHELQTITLDYRRECQQNDMVDSLTSPESAEEGKKHLQPGSTNGSAAKKQHDLDHCQFLHFLRLSGTKLEINRGRTVWRKLVR